MKEKNLEMKENPGGERKIERKISHYERFCKRICERIPQAKREKKYFPMLAYAGIKEDFDFWLGKRMLFTMLVAIIGFLLPWTIGKYFGLIEFDLGFITPIPLIASVGLGIALAIIALLLFYLGLYYRIEGRTTMAEAILPDFLMLVASNVNAGMTPFAAFRSSARKEFGPLSEEVKLAAAKSLGTESFQLALKRLSLRIKSKVLEETIAFFSQTLKSGGHLSKLLETSATDLRQTQELKKELISSTRMYVIFVAFVIVIGAPLLLAVAVQFLDMISAIQAESTIANADLGAVSFLSTELLITPEFMRMVGYALLIGNAILSSMFIGVISNGKAKMGLQYLPAILIASAVVFTVFGFVLSGFLGA
ncbi:MAG: type II secretion system F family protein [Candidatus Diapherotrites archaeon]|nr:type II secretion system F family protein [Candidatus Diapherotrites archaeon]